MYSFQVARTLFVVRILGIVLVVSSSLCTSFSLPRVLVLLAVVNLSPLRDPVLLQRGLLLWPRSGVLGVLSLIENLVLLLLLAGGSFGGVSQIGTAVCLQLFLVRTIIDYP